MIETKATPSVRTLSNGHKVGSSGAGVAMLCFFLPWVMVSCGNQPIASFGGILLMLGGLAGLGAFIFFDYIATETTSSSKGSERR